MQRQATQEQLDSTQTPEFQANLRELVAEPGQISLAHKFLSSSNFGSTKGPLTPMEFRILKNCNKPLPSD